MQAPDVDAWRDDHKTIGVTYRHHGVFKRNDFLFYILTLVLCRLLVAMSQI